MMLLHEVEKGALVYRVLDCDCGREECTTVFIVGALRPQELWLTLAIVPEDKVGEHMQQILALAGDELYAVLHGTALCGLVYSKLDAVTCLHQLQAWADIPDWMARVPIETVWATRRAVFGNDVTRTIRALVALDRAVPELEEGPVPAPTMEVLIGRQMKVAYDPEKRSMS